MKQALQNQNKPLWNMPVKLFFKKAEFSKFFTWSQWYKLTFSVSGMSSLRSHVERSGLTYWLATQGQSGLYKTASYIFNTSQYKPTITVRNLRNSSPALRRRSWSSQSVNINAYGGNESKQKTTSLPKRFQGNVDAKFSQNTGKEDSLLVSNSLKKKRTL